jgi:hypothetical protein
MQLHQLQEPPLPLRAPEHAACALCPCCRMLARPLPDETARCKLDHRMTTRPCKRMQPVLFPTCSVKDHILRHGVTGPL